MGWQRVKVLVTGGAGFIGSHVVDKLVDSGYEVVVVDNLSTGKREYIHSEAKFYQADITAAEITEVFDAEKPEFIIHHAAQINVQSSIVDPTRDANLNIVGTVNLLTNAVKYGVRRVVYASSAAAYGNPVYLPIDEKHPISPMSFYGLSKYAPERYIELFSSLYGLDYTILRYANVYGPRQDPKGEAGVVSIFVDKILNNESPAIYGDGLQTRDFVYVKDVADANVTALRSAVNGVFNVSSCEQTTINDLLGIINGIVRENIEPTYCSSRDGDIVHSYLDNSSITASLGWRPGFGLRTGLEELIQFVLANRAEIIA